VDATSRIETIAGDSLSVLSYGRPISEMDPLVLKEVVETAITGDITANISVNFECEKSIRFRRDLFSTQ